MPKLLIFDGFTKDAFVGPKGGFPQISIKYRPALPKEVNGYLDTKTVSNDDVINNMVTFVQSHLVDWDVEDEQGNKATIEGPNGIENLKRIPFPYLRDILDIITCYKQTEVQVKN